jgi:hypothetical protein
MNRGLLRFPNNGVQSCFDAWLLNGLNIAAIRLYANNPVYTPAIAPSAYVEAAFPGYIPILTPPWNGPYLNDEGVFQIDSGPCLWQFRSNASSATVEGIYVTDLVKSQLFMVVPFLAPVTLTPTERNLIQTVKFALQSLY